jgi:hypothetical protein
MAQQDSSLQKCGGAQILEEKLMRSSHVVTASGWQCNKPGFDPSNFRHKGICEAADEAVLNNVHKMKEKTNLEINKQIKEINKDKQLCDNLSAHTGKAILYWSHVVHT